MTNELAVQDKAALEFFKQNAQVDMGDVGEGQTPVLSLISSQSNVIKEGLTDAEGKDFKIGNWMLNVTNEQFKTVNAHILYVKKTELPDFTHPDVKKLTYVVGGMLKDRQLPFITYVKGMSLNQLWDLQKELTKFASHPELPIPSFALTVQFGTLIRESSKFGKVKAANFEIVRDDKGHPVLETNVETLQKLKASVPLMQQSIERVIAAALKESQPIYEDNVPAEQGSEPPIDMDQTEVEDVSDQIPF